MSYLELETPWSDSYLMGRIREILQDGSGANWMKSYVEKSTFGLSLVVTMQAAGTGWGVMLPYKLSNLITEAGWDFTHLEHDSDSAYAHFALRKKR
jgi:hypothetical protein